jgi:serine/threonine protein phosphatase PrpC
MASPKPREDQIDVFGVTHPGLVRSNNQDHFLISSLGARLVVHQSSLPQLPDEPVIPELGAGERAAFLAVVADGVGGAAAGEEASRMAIEAVTLFFARSMHAFYSTDPGDDAALTQALEQAALRSHAEIVSRGEADATRAGMATTLTLWLGVWPLAYVMQVGDSRYYLYRDGELTQVSRDQTVAQELIDQGALTPTQASRTRWAHVLSSAIGGPNAAPTITRVQNDWATTHLLCSDGLTKHVSDERIRERLARMTSSRQVCEALLQDALDGGGTDNITIIVGRPKA